MDRFGEPQLFADREKLEERVRLLATHLAETQLQLQAILDSSKDGIILLDKGQNIVRINEAGAQLLGLVGIKRWDERVKDVYEICSPDGIPLPFENWPITLVFNGHFVHNYQVLIRRKDTGQTVPS